MQFVSDRDRLMNVLLRQEKENSARDFVPFELLKEYFDALNAEVLTELLVFVI